VRLRTDRTRGRRESRRATCDPRLLRASEVSGYGLDAQWSDDFHHALHAVLTMNGTVHYADFGSLSIWASAFDAFRLRRSLLAVSRPPHGRPATGLDGESLRGLSAEPRSGRQSRRR